jgi:hypothetical protein
MPKARAANLDDLEALKEELEAAIKKAKKECLDSTSSAESKLKEAIDKGDSNNLGAAQQEDQNTLQTANSYCEERIAAVMKEMQGQIDKVQSTEGGKIQEMDSRLSPVEGNVMKALQAAIPRVEQTFKTELDNLDARIAKAMKDMEDAEKKEEARLEQRIAEEAKLANDRLQEGLRKVAGGSNDGEEKLHARCDSLNARAEDLQAQMTANVAKLEESLSHLKMVSEEQVSIVDKKAREKLEGLQADTLKRFADVDEYSRSLSKCLSEIENIPTRRVEWRIPNAAERMRPWDTAKASLYTSWFSPRFEAAGMHDLQLEIRLFRQADTNVEGQEAGDTSVFLWACKGVTVTFRLYIGTKTATFEKVFHGRVPYGAKRLCFVSDEIEKSEDLLRVGVEILEVRRDIEKTLGASPDDEPLEGSIVFQRNINNRLLEQVQGISDIMRSRLVKRVEWRVQHASLLQRCFPHGREICSPTFVAAGIEGMQLVLYPSGYAGATDHFCSIFLFAPAGSTINGHICAHKHKHKIHHTFEMAGAFGRTNFGRFETVIGEDDTVTIALEIVEASQDVRAVAQHQYLAGDVREGSADDIPPEGIGSVIKLQRSASKFNGLEDVQQLPSLWTAQPIGNMATAIPDGYHTFSEIQDRSNELAARSGGRRKPPRSESTPHLHADGTSEYIPKPNHDLASLQPPLPTAGAGHYAGTHGKLRNGHNGLNLAKLSPLARTK